MIYFLDCTNNKNIQYYDICIIGSGVATFSMLAKFIDLKTNLKIAVLEGSTNWNERIHLGNNSYFKYAKEQDVYAGEICGWIKDRSPDYLLTSRIRTYGGTAHSGWVWPLDRVDFEVRKFHNGINWPITYDEIKNFYNEASKLYRLDNYNFYYPEKYTKSIQYKQLELIPLENGYLHTKILKFNPHYLHYYYNDLILNSENIHVFRNANCINFETINKLNKLTKIVAVYAQTIEDDLPGKIIKFRANKFILAAGALETTRLLLLNENFKKNKELGKNFLEHPYLWVAAKFKYKNIPNTIRNFYFCKTPIITYNNIGIVPALIPNSEFIKLKNIGNFRILLGGGTDIPGTLNISWEQTPNRNSYITLSENTKPDLFGQKRLKIKHTLSEIDKFTISEAIKIGQHTLDKLGYAYNWELPNNNLDPWLWNKPGYIVPGNHVMGTTRMSIDRTNGVVDTNCKLHDSENLFIASSSVFPTGGYANPNFTISALSLRLAKYIKEL